MTENTVSGNYVVLSNLCDILGQTPLPCKSQRQSPLLTLNQQNSIFFTNANTIHYQFIWN